MSSDTSTITNPFYGSFCRTIWMCRCHNDQRFWRRYWSPCHPVPVHWLAC